MESINFENVLNALPGTGVYIIREADRRILYVNDHVQEVSPKTRPGEICYQVWDGSCDACPLRDIGERKEIRTIGYSAAYGGVVDITASRIMWEESIPSFVLAITSRTELNGCARRDVQLASILKARHRMMTTIDLDSGLCRRADLSLPEDAELSGDYAKYVELALSKFVYPEDAADYWDTLCLDHLREQGARTQDFAEERFVYRQRGEPIRWIELQIIFTRQDGRMTTHLLGQDVTKEKQQEESRRLALEERAYIISSLSSLFFATYYIDLETGMFRAVTQLHRVGGLLGDEVNYTSALQIYANHFIHPDDREEYLQLMSYENLRQTLRWWRPCVAMEYRKLPDIPGSGPCEWVRATAMLARSGPDDLPQTAIYVAQNTTEGHRSEYPASVQTKI